MAGKTTSSLAAGLCLALAACGGGAAPALCTVELNGDSIMAGQGIQTSPASRLAQLRPRAKVDDRGIPGLTLQDLYAGYQTAYAGGPEPRLGPQPPFAQAQHSSEVVVIELGANDAYGGLPLEGVDAQLRHLVRTIRAQGRMPMFTGIVALDPSPIFDTATVARIRAVDAITQRVAADMGVVSARWDTVEYHGLLDTVDGVHRKQAASDRLAQRLAEVLDEMVPLCR